jgi:hypothetical protein
MFHYLEQLASSLWNRIDGRRKARNEHGGGSMVGFAVADEQPTRRRLRLSHARRTMHIAIFGKTGTGKSSFIKHLALQDIEAGRGAVIIDLHGDTTPFILGAVAAAEWKLREHLSDRLTVFSPSDAEMSVGLNPLSGGEENFVAIAEIAELLKMYWGLDRFGARTDELLRNTLFVLAANSLTLLEIAPFLTHAGFRTKCLKAVRNAEVRAYFQSRYGAASEPMQAAMREPILNKTSAFTADPRFRHIVGQQKPTFSIQEALDNGHTILLHLPKGQLGPQALTLAGLFFTMVKNALFTRTKRTLYTLYCDEIQNLVAQSNDVETVLSEARKFGVGVVSANQFLDQHSASLRAALLSVGTHVFFQLSGADALIIAQMLDGGRPLAERLKNLPQRHFILKSGADRWVEGVVPKVEEQRTSYTDLLNRSRALRARPRAEIERDIAERHAELKHTTDEVLHEWQ